MKECGDTFILVLHKTYYKTGFFNVPVARGNRTANTDFTARVMDGTALRDIFQKHFLEMGKLVVALAAKDQLCLKEIA